jgi:hypothetical protein
MRRYFLPGRLIEVVREVVTIVSVSYQSSKKKSSISYQSYALAYPGAVVVELVDAVVADGAVRASRSAIDLADPAKPEPHFDTVDHHEATRSAY